MPVLSGFLPIPLAMMIPFMGAQSLVLGKQFGEGFQYGKRKISAMSNEEFNKITPAILAQNNANELKQMIPSMQASITDMRSFQSFIVKELIETVKQLPSDVFSGIVGGDPSIPNSGNLEQAIFKKLVETLETVASKGIQLNVGGLGNLIPNIPIIHAEEPPSNEIIFEKSGEPPPKQTRTIQQILDEYRAMTLSQVQQIRNFHQNNKFSPEYQAAVQIIKEKIDAIKAIPKPKIIQTTLGRTSKTLQDKLLKYLNKYNTAINLIAWVNKTIPIRLKGSGQNKLTIPSLKILRTKAEKDKNLARDIFNVALKQSRNYKDLTPAWGKVQPLK